VVTYGRGVVELGCGAGLECAAVAAAGVSGAAGAGVGVAAGLAGVAGGVSSSDMPFLNALMPCAMSPISFGILPAPNNSSTITKTTSQCQMLNEPMINSPKSVRGRYSIEQSSGAW